MDDKKIREDLNKRTERQGELFEELLEAVTAINGILPQYMDDIDDYKETSTIKTDWLNKKMR